MRVMLASDQPEIRRYLGKVVAEKLGGVVVGEGENAIKALGMARRLRPDMAIIDSYLPHSTGLVDVPLSHSAGLDTAQAISDEIPNVRVVLLDSTRVASIYSDLESAVLWPAAAIAPEVGLPRSESSVTYASLEARPVPRQKPGFSSICVTLGICGLLSGLVLTASLILAYVGLPLLLIGAVSLFIGGLIKVLSPLPPEKAEELEPDGPRRSGKK